MNTININFIEREVVSVAEIKRNRELKMISFILLFFILLFTVISFGLNYYFSRRFDELTKIQEGLIAQVGSPENKKKEALFFLIKDRLSKINVIKNERLEFSPKLAELKNINEKLAVKSFSFSGGVCTLELITDDYNKFEDLLTDIDDYKINRDSLVVKHTSFEEQKYQIGLQFSFL